ncbi:hydroxymethylpyrimidine/phosphomethylpyrimidine kinase [Undibacterium luofuense]|uniref:bifunctional hydroxymethylpyrimidine kinase/phosphomethylpyrimidine kinase n=1 Tax=Undibacterium luofuense TaxID=2828733 RepID=UPI0030EC6E79
MHSSDKPLVLVLAGHDPGGGAGIMADAEAIAAQGAHALTVITALTVQDHNRVYAVHPVSPEIVAHQLDVFSRCYRFAAIKIGIVGSAAMAAMLAQRIAQLRAQQADLPVVLDTVLGSGHGDRLGVDDAVQSLQPLLQQATLLTPNLPELARLSAMPQADWRTQLAAWMPSQSADVLVKGGHSDEQAVRNVWFRQRDCQSDYQPSQEWQWPRLSGEFHGSGCTLAAAIAGQLACGAAMPEALSRAQAYTQQALERAFSVGAGQKIPDRS